MPKQRREGEANGPRGQRPPGASQAGPSWTEFVRPAHQAVVAFAGAGIINRAEPRACGHSREPIYLDSEPDTERNAGSASNAAGDGCGRARSDKAGFQPYRGKLAVRDEQRGWGKRRQDLMAVCHDARKGRNIGIHWSKPVAPPLHSTSKQRCLGLGIKGVTLHSYRYAWAERAKKAGYPERFAMDNLGQNSKAVHRAYLRKAQVELPSLGEYERRRKAFANGSGIEPVAQAVIA